MLSLSKHLCRLFVALLAVSVGLCSAFARSKSRSRGYQGTNQLAQLNAALKSNDVESAQNIAAAIYVQATNASALQSTDPTIIVDPVVIAQTVEFNRTKSACDIAACFYSHADLDDAEQWATTATTGGTLSEEYVRRATVLLGNIATAMDNDAVAVTNFLSVITLPGLYREQPLAYAGLLEALMLQKQDDQVTQWVQNGQAQFAGAGDLQLAFLRDAAKALKRRNNPLWNGLDQQIVGLSSSSAGNQLQALRELASNARKFGRWAEAETNYAAICAMPLNSAQDTVDSYLFLAECQAQQGEDITATLSNLTMQCEAFADSQNCEYGTYRTAKFYEDQGSNDLAAASYGALVSSLSTSTWAAAALHQLGALRERQGDLQSALQLYLQYPQQFPQNQQLVIQSYGNALNVANALGDTSTAAQVVATITNNASLIQNYNTQLNLAYYFQRRKTRDLANSFLATGMQLAQQTLNATSEPTQRSLIHFRVLRRLCDFGKLQGVLDYFAANTSDFPPAALNASDNAWFCIYFKALALYGIGQQAEATNQLQVLLDQVMTDVKLEAAFGETLGYLSITGTNAQGGAQLLQAVVDKYPSQPWTNLGRLQLAAYKFNTGDPDGAITLADEIISSTSETSKSTLVIQSHWCAMYIRGRCLQMQGNTQMGQALVQSALVKVPGAQAQLSLN